MELDQAIFFLISYPVILISFLMGGMFLVDVARGK